MTFSYHPDYGYTDEFRTAVLRHAKRYSVKVAARRFAVSQTSIYNWRKAVV